MLTSAATIKAMQKVRCGFVLDPPSIWLRMGYAKSSTLSGGGDVCPVVEHLVCTQKDPGAVLGSTAGKGPPETLERFHTASQSTELKRSLV